VLDDGQASVQVKGAFVCLAAAAAGLFFTGLLTTVLGWSLGGFLDLARCVTVGSWPVHRGYVQDWGVKNRGNGGYWAWADFLYQVDEEVYRGWRPRLDQPDYASEVSAREGLAGFPISVELRVSVNPLDPTDAVLDPVAKDWKSLGLRLAVACLLLSLSGYLLAALGVPYYAMALALCGLIGLGGLCRTMSLGPSARREGISPSQMWQRHAQLSEMRDAWTKLKPGDLVISAPAIGQPDTTIASAGGGQTWVFDLDVGLETAGKLQVMPSTKGWVVDRVFPPYLSTP
jgi:hypothetical protein